MKALPTIYRGVQYRSLLEARYAAWFDLVGLRVVYEPEAFNGYIPDFVWAHDTSHDRERSFGMYVDGDWLCGPSIVFEVKGALEQQDTEKMLHSGFSGAIVILDGRGPAFGQTLCGTQILEIDDGGGAVASFPEACRCNWFGPTILDLENTWREAGNLVQWRSPRRR